jgi:hypothetical protein
MANLSIRIRLEEGPLARLSAREVAAIAAARR